MLGFLSCKFRMRRPRGSDGRAHANCVEAKKQLLDTRVSPPNTRTARDSNSVAGFPATATELPLL